ncbi:MAG: 1-acyl-sn-glycerol-3-phosphate acyltransferase [Bacteroidales bacterium]|nr:1-acyl-sn-glycerol-3-phosphate acyltransferase [Bacteroidales bacterium]
MKNAIIIEAPHTSMWDFVWGRAGLWALGIKCHFLIKKELFFFPLGLILRALGAVPVNRGKDGKGFFDEIINELKSNGNFSLILTPEGTRKRTKNWKKGFYFIATESGKPIFMAWIDYKKKTCGVNKESKLIPTGDYQKDFEKIREFYKDITAKHPEQFTV